MPDPASLPYPPRELLDRIGPMGDEDPVGVYEETGRDHRALLESVLPDEWSWQGKRVLDFGCGSGRMLRQFAAEADGAEFWGCDLDTPSVQWLEESLSPPFNFFESGEAPGLPQEDGFFDLIYAFSVYTHFTDNWAGWLREHHRVLKDGGLLFVTFLGEGMLEPLTGEKWDEDVIGMNPLLHGYPWALGGPIAINSPWWIRAHWGRAFEIVELRPVVKTGEPSHGIVLARKKPVEITVEELTALEPGEPREIPALRHHVEQLAAETERLQGSHQVHADRIAELTAEAERLQGERQAEEERRQAEAEHAGRLQGRVQGLEGSLSWRLTAPLRAARQRLAARRRP
jgi:SAM-dependent methyltransferase